MKLIAALLAAALLYIAGAQRFGVPLTMTWCIPLPIAIGIEGHQICVDHHFTVRLE